MYRRAAHNRAAAVLEAMDADLIRSCSCLFGGGTAASMLLDEYRESADIDLLCHSAEGYRRLRAALYHDGFRTLFPDAPHIGMAREIRADGYGVRTVVMVDGQPVRLEFIRSENIQPDPPDIDLHGIPVLSRTDIFAEKLLANSSRWADRKTDSRDIIDLSIMCIHWNGIRENAWNRIDLLYREIVLTAWNKAVLRIRDPDWLDGCMKRMSMDPSLAEDILTLHGGGRKEFPSPFDP